MQQSLQRKKKLYFIIVTFGDIQTPEISVINLSAGDVWLQNYPRTTPSVLWMKH